MSDSSTPTRPSQSTWALLRVALMVSCAVAAVLLCLAVFGTLAMTGVVLSNPRGRDGFVVGGCVLVAALCILAVIRIRRRLRAFRRLETLYLEANQASLPPTDVSGLFRLGRARTRALVLYLAAGGSLSYPGVGSNSGYGVGGVEYQALWALLAASVVLAIAATPVWLSTRYTARQDAARRPRYIEACASMPAITLALLLCAVSTIGATQ